MSLNDLPIENVKGVGPKKRELYHKMGVYTASDLLYYFPLEYVDYRNPKSIYDLQEGEKALTGGLVKNVTFDKRGYKKGILRFTIQEGNASLQIVFFNAFYLSGNIKNGEFYYFYGKVTSFNGRLNMVNPSLIHKENLKREILPIYKLPKGISQNELRKNIRGFLAGETIKEYLPNELIEKNKLCSLHYAISNLHFPMDEHHYRAACYRQIYDELFIMQLGIQAMKMPDKKGNAMQAKTDDFLNILPFELTASQKKVLTEAENDMQEPKAMNRLVQGDVGSGKTVIAAACMYKAVKSGFQAVMMAPTEILARQHFASLKQNFERLGIRVCLLIGGLKKSERTEILQKIANGTYDIIIGTHAVIQKDVLYKNLGIVITDEQHRFGVNQRLNLGEKGKNPDILVMTATPIPRTLAVILYGDLDISIIDTLPSGRKPIKTFAISEKQRLCMYKKIADEIKKGRQAYVVAPLIEESEALSEVKSTEQIYEELSSIYKEEIKSGEIKMAVVHGAMKQQEKDEIMQSFAKNEISLLIATSVIEVGIDVPNATTIVIENAERFGLSQLHQLRGRVGRGEQESRCFLVSSTGSEIAKKRMQIMTESTDGFYISDKDLELRGPGEIFGTRQHGIPDRCVMEAIKYIDILEVAKKDAARYIDNISDDLQQRVDNMFDIKKVTTL